MRTVKRLALVAMAAATLALAGCGGGGSSPSTTPKTPTTQMPTQTPYQKAEAAIKAATTDAAVDKAVADATAGVSGAELAKLQAAAAARKTALATMARTEAQKTMARTEAQKKALMDALAEVDTSDLSDADKLAAAKAAIAALKEALDGAADVSDADKATYRTQLASAEKDVRRKEQMNALSAASGELAMLAAGAEQDAFPTETQLDAAITALEAAISGAEDLTDDEKAPYLELLVVKEPLVWCSIARTSTRCLGSELNLFYRIIQQIDAITEPIGMITPLSDNSTVTDVEAAIAAAKTAIMDANIPELNKELLRMRLALQEDAFGNAKKARMDGHKMGRALYAAMGPSDDTTAPVNALNNLATVPYYITSITDSQHDAPAEATGQRGERGDFRIDPAAGAGSIATANTHTAVYFRHGAEGRPGHDTAMDKVGRWNVTHYERTTGSGSMKVTDKVRVYNDRQGGPLERWGVVPMDAAKFFKDDTDWINKGTYTAESRKLSLGTGADRAIASETFDKWTVRIGSVTAPKPTDGGAEIKIPGTYYGAPGTYFCPVSGTCIIGTGVGGYYFLSDGWYFVHDAGAKVLERDLSYMYFGWWVRNDVNGMPAAVSAFYRSTGGDIELTTDGGSLNGVARYEGPAVGVYAIHDPLNEKGDGGDFTATAKLLAKFGATNLVPEAGMTGTIDGFRLDNGSEPNWSVTLQKGAWTTGASREIGAQKGHTDKTAKTVWSINGTKETPAGSWVASLYDEAVGTIADGGDGSDRPSSVLGKFYAEHGDTHRMVGAFGAKIQLEE